jgi:hypothetical protein
MAPYLITIESDAVVGKDFVPELSLDDVRPITSGCRLTDVQKAAIPRVLKLSNIGTKSASFPDVIGWNIGPWIVSERLRDKIDELEPGIHEFVPLAASYKGDNRECKPYYFLLLTQALDAVVMEETKFQSGFGPEAAKASRFLLDKFGGPCTLRAEKVAGHHLWRGLDEMRLSYFCSDELADYFSHEKMLG